MDAAEKTESTPLLTKTKASTSSLTKGTSSRFKSMKADDAVNSKVTHIANLARERTRLKKLRGGRGHSFWFSVLSEHSHRKEAEVYRTFITTLIILNVFSFILQSDQTLDDRYSREWDLLEGFSSIVFFIEYCIRLYTRPECRKYAGMDPYSARLQWAMSFDSITDVVSFMPWFVEIGSKVVWGNAWTLPNLSWVRVLRLFRLLKSNSIMEAFDVFARVVYFNGDILLVALILCMILLLVLSTLLFYMAPPETADSADFSSIPATMYLSVMMLTGQGQPEGTMPWYTKLICVITAVFAVAQFAIPASMLTWGFEAEAQRRIKKKHDDRMKQLQKIKDNKWQENDDVSSESSDGNDDDFADEWKEYEALIAGDSDEEPDEESAKETSAAAGMLSGVSAGPGSLTARQYARVLRIFSSLDSEENGYIITRDLLDIKGFDVDALSKELDPDGDGRTQCEDFIDWLCRVRNSHTQDPEIFEMLLSELEEVRVRIVKQKSSRSLGELVPLSPVSVAASTAQSALPDQLIKFAEEFKRLQQEVVSMQEQLRLKDAEIAKLRKK
jgi:voltage-gated potassium channel